MIASLLLFLKNILMLDISIIEGINLMRNTIAKMLGVTLLEIMLVLAIAALIIVMSVRYFQSASISQQAVAYTSQLQAIAAAENSLSQGTGSYVENYSTLASILPAGGMTNPWGGSVEVVTSTAGQFTVKAPESVSTGVCTLVQKQLQLGGPGSSNWKVSPSNCRAVYSLNPSAN